LVPQITYDAPKLENQLVNAICRKSNCVPSASYHTNALRENTEVLSVNAGDAICGVPKSLDKFQEFTSKQREKFQVSGNERFPSLNEGLHSTINTLTM
jgi:hypothetical protein